MRRLILLVLVAVVACELSESPTAPQDGSPVGSPAFSFTGGSGRVLGSTNQGELIEIDFDAGTATLIGDAGIFDGDSVGWTDIAFDNTGTLYGLSRIFFESDFEVHLYTIDPSDGSVLSDVGSAGDHTFSDFDHDGTTFYGSGAVDVFLCCGQLFSMDAATAQATWISSDTLGFGPNPFDTLQSPFDPIARGGFSVHPVTGEFWGIETLHSQATVLFRIDPITGLADSIMKVGPPEFGYDGLHILDDGTFIATRGGPFSNDSVLWEIDLTPDSLGVVPIQHIPLVFDSQIVGNLNGLESLAPTQEPLVLSLTSDTTELHPWVRFFAPYAPAPWVEPGRLPGDASITLSVSIGGQAVQGLEVSFRAEFLDTLAGHEHLSGRVDIDDAHLADLPGTELAGDDKPVLGMFVHVGDTVTTVNETTDSSGEIAFTFVAGFVSGALDVIASTSYGNATLEDTLRVLVQVPNLVSLDANPAITSSALMVGATAHHLGGDNRYATTAFDDALEMMVTALQTDSTYLQLNDASLPRGGSFTVTPPQIGTGVRVEQPGLGHRSHAEGNDQDVGLCYADSPGFDEVNDEITGADCLAGQGVMVSELVLGGFGFVVLREGDHFHLRLEQP